MRSRIVLHLISCLASQLPRKFDGHDDVLVATILGIKLKLNKGMQLLCLNGKWIPFEDAAGKHATIQVRAFACAAKDKDGLNSGAHICLSTVEGTELEETATSLDELPKSEGQNVSAPVFDVPKAGSGSARSPEDVPAAAAKPAAAAAAAAAGKPAARSRVRARPPEEQPAAAAAESVPGPEQPAPAGGKSPAVRTRVRGRAD